MNQETETDVATKSYIKQIEAITGYELYPAAGNKIEVGVGAGAQVAISLSFRVKDNPYRAGYMSLYGQQLFGCCGVMVLSKANVSGTNMNKKGLGHLLMKMGLQAAWKAGYTTVVATDITKNAATKKIFEKAGFTKYSSFKNRRTGNTVECWTIDLKEDKTPVGVIK
jgi:hypothetical protein